MSSSTDNKKRLIETTIISDDGCNINEENSVESSVKTENPTKRKRLAVDNSTLLNNIPLASSYTYSYKTDATITALAKGLEDSLVISGDSTGVVKFWKQKRLDKDEEQNGQLTIIKQFQPHTTKVRQLIVNLDGLKLISVAENDKSIMVFDLTTLDLTQVIKVDFFPNVSTTSSICWYTLHNVELILLNEKDSNNLYRLDPQKDEVEALPQIHKFDIVSVIFNLKYQCFISVDSKGIIEIWSPIDFKIPSNVEYKLKSQTDLFEVVKNKSNILAICLSEDNESFAVASQPDDLIRVFNVVTGKVTSKIDIASTDNTLTDTGVSTLKFHKDDRLLLFATCEGIHVLDVRTSLVVRTIGMEDSHMLSIKFDQFILLSKLSMAKVTKEMMIAENRLINSKLTKKPMVLATMKGSQALYCYSDYHVDVSTRDLVMTAGKVKKQKTQKYSHATLRTTAGDIKIKLFDKLAPKTVENFIGLAQKRYYNNVIFHRVIKNFMIQTGDPQGDGTGGESLWGGEFEDEFNVLLTHSKPFMVSMANAGPNTNGSQFFITTEKCNHLDNKHSIFGEVVHGFDVVREIENAKTDKTDKPLNQIAILSVSLLK
jgi:peptidylprolyl isomerase domain and WD repeat-containing protein 1